MTVGDLYRQLSHIELRDMATSVEGTGVIREAQRPAVISAANDGLTRLFTHFFLWEKEVELSVDSTIERYLLIPGSPYILTPDFAGDIIRIHAVYGDYDRMLALDDENHPLSLRTLRPNEISVPKELGEDVLRVRYQAKHPELVADDLDMPIELPAGLEEALRAYVAAKIYGSVQSAERLRAAAAHMTRFQGIVQDAEQQGWLPQVRHTTNTKFSDRGWV